MLKVPYCVCVFMCVFKFFSEITEPTGANFPVQGPGDRGGNFIQMIQVNCCSFLYCQPLGAGAFSGDFTTNLARQCRAFRRALKISATNDWCIAGTTLFFLESPSLAEFSL